MADYQWPEDLIPFAQTFFLQSHTGRSVSPFTRQQRIYALSRPLWVCRMALRGGYNGRDGLAALGARADAFIAKLKGGQNRVAIYDFRRWQMRGIGWAHNATNEAAEAGDTTMTITGLSPFALVQAGDYLGGDGRPHIITDDARADSGGEVEVSFEPPLEDDIDAGEAVFGKPTGWFRLADDDAGQNPTTVGEAVTYELAFIEDI